MTAPDYRDPKRIAETHEIDRRINAVLDVAVDNLASLVYLVDDDADPVLVEQWVDTTYDHLRAALSVEDLIRAVALLLHKRAEAKAEALGHMGGVTA